MIFKKVFFFKNIKYLILGVGGGGGGGGSQNLT